MRSMYSFERTELRVLQNQCNGDNELFLNLLADKIGSMSIELTQTKTALHMAEHRLRVIDND